MRLWWMLAPALLLLVACRGEGERGAGLERAPSTTGARSAQGERPTAPAEDATGTPRMLAAVRSMLQAEVEAGKLAEQRASSPDVKAYATRLVAECQADVDAIGDIAKAKKIELEGASVQNDPFLRAGKTTAKDSLDRLRALSGTAFDGAFMTGQRAGQLALVHLAAEGPQGAHDTDVANVLRTIAQQARDRANRVLTILPKACGGDRAGWGGAG